MLIPILFGKICNLAIETLWKIDPQNLEFQKVISGALVHREWGVRKTANIYLRLMKPADPHIRLAIARTLEDEHSAVRASAAAAIKEIKPKDKTTLSAIVKCLKNPQLSIREVCGELLGMLQKAGEMCIPDFFTAPLSEEEIRNLLEVLNSEKY